MLCGTHRQPKVPHVIAIIPFDSPLISHLDLLPVNCISVAQVSVRSVVWIRSPPYDHEGKADVEGDPTTFCATSYDGSMYATDMRDPYSNVVFRARGESGCVSTVKRRGA